ncbi:hypothetical protein POVWA2_012140 [Plasmodium ovale wallikeri]|uniref:Uncharacterized protein n=1 Tax=Plasmodium ovale wallikeri TaxID=864142 RepID=A0A1A8YNF1_PLAOA|nr:hypothetical protein POVWA2_012140 [Plasmodium ovale wallikeri]
MLPLYTCHFTALHIPCYRVAYPVLPRCLSRVTALHIPCYRVAYPVLPRCISPVTALLIPCYRVAYPVLSRRYSYSLLLPLTKNSVVSTHVEGYANHKLKNKMVIAHRNSEKPFWKP